MARRSFDDYALYGFEPPMLFHPPTPEHEKGRIIGIEEMKDAGVLTSRQEYDSDGIETTNVDSPPPGSDVEKRRHKKKSKRPSASLEDDTSIEFAPPKRKRPAPYDSEPRINTTSPETSSPPISSKTPSKAFSTLNNIETPTPKKQHKARTSTKSIPWHPDEHEWMKQLISDNMGQTWGWYAEQNRLRFQGTQYTDPVTGEIKEGLRDVRSRDGIRERFSAWKKLVVERKGLSGQ